jgi:hypothetical protein
LPRHAAHPGSATRSTPGRGRYPGGSDGGGGTTTSGTTTSGTTTWTEPVEWDDRPTTTWTRPGSSSGPGRRWEDRAAKGRRRWRSAQMLFRRRYNTAAAVTVALVATVLFLLSAIPTGNRDRAGAAHAAPASPTRPAVVSFEAESPANALIGSASIGSYPGASGGQVVRSIGDWGSANGMGELRFNNIVVPADGQYLMTFYFVNIKASGTRTAIITPSASQSVMVTVASNALCCTAQPVKVFLAKGTNSITFSNPMHEAPAIDKITIALR